MRRFAKEGAVIGRQQTRRGTDAFTDLWKRVDSAIGALLDTTTFAELARRWKEAQTRFVPNWDI